MSLMASLVTTSRMQQCFNVPIDSYHEFLLLFYCCVLLEIKLTTTTTRRSAIFIKHFLWHYITVNHSRTYSICAQLVPSMSCPNGHTSIYEPWDWLVWAIDSSQPTMAVGRLDQMSSHVVPFWVLSLVFWIKVFGDGHHWLLSPCCYTTSMWAVPTCNRQNLGAISFRLDTQKHLDDLLHSAGRPPLSFLAEGYHTIRASVCTEDY